MITVTNYKIQKGITILEVLMILIVTGLIISGILVKGLIEHQAKISNEIKYLSELESAFNSFGLKYKAMPGDFKNAEDIWSSTQNGNGDSTIRTKEGRFSDEYTYGGEMSHVFEQLSLAYMLNEKFDSSITLGKGIPTSTLNPKMGISLYNGTKDEVSINVFYGNATALPSLEKADEPNSVTGNTSGFLKPEEVYSLKEKLGEQRLSDYCGIINGNRWCRYWYVIK
ncbi:MAG: hypothetical protein COV35_09105 [Alphaproteobacteria bacterium CG11_big_fil_rev_8_21_14_0_20_39_49]|nr:MAG: hypothetical protein COV35_09105 [Alphaproteobacteria bacterium CG11_big_fil_rev_8_21_14_0_20_39_49]